MKETPLSSLISASPIVSLFIHLGLVFVFQMVAFEHVRSQDWFMPFNNSATEGTDEVACVENYAVYTVSSFQYIILAIVFSKGKPYRESIFTNYSLIISAFAMTCFSIYLAVHPDPYLASLFELVLPPNYTFRIYLLFYALANFVLSLFVELVIIDYIFFKKLRFKFHNVYKSKRKYLAIERDLNLDTKWPVLTSDFRSAASPLSSEPHCTAEIVIEKENKFDKNHVLNSLYDESKANYTRSCDNVLDQVAPMQRLNSKSMDNALMSLEMYSFENR